VRCSGDPTPACAAALAVLARARGAWLAHHGGGGAGDGTEAGPSTRGGNTAALFAALARGLAAAVRAHVRRFRFSPMGGVQLIRDLVAYQVRPPPLPTCPPAPSRHARGSEPRLSTVPGQSTGRRPLRGCAPSDAAPRGRAGPPTARGRRQAEAGALGEEPAARALGALRESAEVLVLSPAQLAARAEAEGHKSPPRAVLDVLALRTDAATLPRNLRPA